MRPVTRLLVATLAASPLLTGCLATRNFTRTLVARQDTAFTTALNTAITTERSARQATDAELKAANDALRQELGAVKGDVQSLRTELQSMRTELGAKISMMEDGMHFLMPVNFAFNDATVRDQDRSTLDRFSKVVQKYYPGSKITIEGFADPAGSTRYNAVLSRKRADAVKDYLTTQGVPNDVLQTIGYGETRLVTPKAWGDQPGAELNRRVVFVVETAAQRSVALSQPESR